MRVHVPAREAVAELHSVVRGGPGAFRRRTGPPGAVRARFVAADAPEKARKARRPLSDRVRQPTDRVRRPRRPLNGRSELNEGPVLCPARPMHRIAGMNAAKKKAKQASHPPLRAVRGGGEQRPTVQLDLSRHCLLCGDTGIRVLRRKGRDEVIKCTHEQPEPN